MCEPVTTTVAVASFALQAGSALAEHEAQAQASKSNKTNSLAALTQTWGDIGLRQRQEQDAASQQMTETDRLAQSVMSSANAAAGEAGVAGTSVHALINDIQRQGAENKVTTQRNLDASMEQLQREKMGAKATAENRIAAAPPPSGFLTALRVGGAAAGAVDYYTSRKPSAGKG